MSIRKINIGRGRYHWTAGKEYIMMSTVEGDGLMDKTNIVLIGMPTVGKSSFGVVLAKALGYRFIDSDLVIQEREGKLLAQLIAEYGTDGFLRLENEINCGINVSDAVIATGGSAVYGAEAMMHFRETGSIVYLEEECNVIMERLIDPKGRGVTIREGQTVAGLYAERKALYEKYAEYTVNVNSKSADEVVTSIINAVRKKQTV